MKLKALIVDDEIELRKSVISVLQNMQIESDITFEFGEAVTGIEALNKTKSEFWDLILMDVKMPEMDGLTALQQIKEADPRTFVVIMTAHSNLNDAVLAIKDGAYDYVEKPVSPDKLLAIVKKKH